MNLSYRFGRIGTRLAAQTTLAALMIFWLTAGVFGQTDEAVARNNSAPVEKQAVEKKAVLMPLVNDLKGIKLGMTAEEVKDQLGKAKVADDTGFYYIFSDDESMQIALDGDKKVRMVAAIYNGDEAKAPKYEDVFGSDAAVEKQPDGKIYKIVQYPDAGFWVAYNRMMVGDEPMITVTMQKIN